jgi:hypothetical protein
LVRCGVVSSMLLFGKIEVLLNEPDRPATTIYFVL